MAEEVGLHWTVVRQAVVIIDSPLPPSTAGDKLPHSSVAYIRNHYNASQGSIGWPA